MTGDKVVIGMSNALGALILGLMLSLPSCVEPEGGLGGEQELNEEGGEQEPEDASTAEVGLTEYQIEMPTSLSVGTQTFSITNNGTTEHNFEVAGQGTEAVFETNLEPGVTQTMQLNLYQFDVIMLQMFQDQGVG